jgi:hypothetical protein
MQAYGSAYFEAVAVALVEPVEDWIGSSKIDSDGMLPRIHLEMAMEDFNYCGLHSAGTCFTSGSESEIGRFSWDKRPILLVKTP